MERAGYYSKNNPKLLLIKQHINNNFRYTEIAKANGYQGNIVVQFTVDKNGGLLKTLQLLKVSIYP